MKVLSSATVLLVLVFCAVTPVLGQPPELPKPGPEHDVLQSEVGTWNVKIKSWTGPGEPAISEGTETDRMLGGFWLVTDFQGNMMGFDFKGHGIYGYDAKQKQYVGTWIDSMSASRMEMAGTYDEANRVMTLEGVASDLEGKPAKHILTTKYNTDGTRVLTMHMQSGEERTKVFEMHYTRAADDSAAKLDSKQ